MVIGIGELVCTCGQSYHNNTRSACSVCVGYSAVRLANSTANPFRVIAADRPQLTLYNASVEGINRIEHIHTPANARYFDKRVTKIPCPELWTKKTADFHKPTAQLINSNLKPKN